MGLCKSTRIDVCLEISWHSKAILLRPWTKLSLLWAFWVKWQCYWYHASRVFNQLKSWLYFIPTIKWLKYLAISSDYMNSPSRFIICIYSSAWVKSCINVYTYKTQVKIPVCFCFYFKWKIVTWVLSDE